MYLFKGNTPGQELDEISAFDDYVRVPRLPGCGHCHTPFNQVKAARETLPTNHTHFVSTIRVISELHVFLILFFFNLKTPEH